MTSDEALMLKFQRGSREAFEELFARYRGPLLSRSHALEAAPAKIHAESARSLSSPQKSSP